MKIKVKHLKSLIRESIKQSNLLTEKPKMGPKVPAPEKLDTVGDFLQFVKAIVTNKKAVQGAKYGGKAVLEIVPFLGVSKNAISAARALYKLDDKVKTGTGLDNLDVDDKISAIVDDKVENAFLNDLVKKYSSMDPKTPLSKIGVTQQLSNFLRSKFDKRTVSGF